MAHEELGLEISFEEIKIRCESKTIFTVHAISDIDGCLLHENIDVHSWEELKKDYPTLKDLLVQFFLSPYFRVLGNNYDRMIYIKSITGHNELYDFNKNDKEQVFWSEIPEETKRKF